MDQGMELKGNARKVQDELKQMGVKLQVVELPQTTRTAQNAADAIGCEIGQIVKSIILRTKMSSRALCVLTSGTNQVDEKKVERWIGEPIKMADPDFVKNATGFSIGGVAPVGHSNPIITLIDEDLLNYAEIWAAAGTPNAVFRLTPMELLRITRSIAIRVAKEDENQ